MPYDDKGIIFSKLIKAIKHYDKGKMIRELEYVYIVDFE